MNLCPNARCLVGEYVNIYHCDQSGKIGERYMADMQIYPRMRAGETFVAKTVELVPTEINFGVIQETSHYKRKLSVNLLTDQGWLHIVRNEYLESLMDENENPIEWGAM